MAPTMFTSELVDTRDHHQELRRAVAGVVGAFGRKYFQDVVKRDEKPTELWAALAENGFLGVHIPEEDGGGGGGLADYNVVIEETAAQGCPLLSLVIGSRTNIVVSVGSTPRIRLKTGEARRGA